jgi:hypothetical protein
MSKRKREQLERNINRGQLGEDKVELQYGVLGYEVERTGRGSDFRVRRKNYMTGVSESYLVEVKTGDAEVSDLQRKTRKRSKNYTVERVDPWEY